MNIQLPSNWNKLVDAVKAKKLSGVEILTETAPAGYYTKSSDYMMIEKELIWTEGSESLKQSSVDYLIGTIKRLLIEVYVITESSKKLKLTPLLSTTTTLFEQETELERYIEAIIFAIEADRQLLEEFKKTI